MTATEPRGKLDANTANGPEGGVLDWDQVDWGQAEDDVRRLRQRIFTALKAGDLKQVRNLQKLMIRSHANALVSVRRVTEINAGRKTAGVNGKTALLASQKAELAGWVQQRSGSWMPKPVRRVCVPKKDGRRRPLGIPVIRDRAYLRCCRQCAGTGVGGKVRVEVLWISARPWLPGRDPSHLRDRPRDDMSPGVGA